MTGGTVEQIKSKLNIVDVVGSYLKLDKAGGNLKAKCPFHNEKTPSFFVSPVRDTFHCFGCGKGGDIFEFVKEMEGVEFVDALKILAERAGVKIIREDSALRSEKGRLIAAVENAKLFFRNELPKNLSAVGYLKKRGLTDKTIKDWELGYAPDSWRALRDYLAKLKFSDSEMERAGLVIRSAKGHYDRFRNRIMFPINNISGVTVGFTGRVMPGADKAAGKYVNSPETELYNKSKILFGFDRGRVSMRTSDSCILVEGQIDLIMSHQSGNLNTAAVSGTALTDEHLKSIKRLANKLILAFDGDEAGFKASRRGIDMALAMGMDVRAAGLPEGKDPADLILEDPGKWTKAVSGARHIIDFYLETLRSKNLEPRLLKIKVEELVLPYVAKIKSSIEQAHFVSVIAGALAMDEQPIWETLKRLEIQSAGTNRASPDPDGGPQSQTSGDSREDLILKKIIGTLLWQREVNPDKTAELDSFENETKLAVGEGKYFLLLETLKDKKDSLIFEAEISLAGADNLSDYLDSLVSGLKEETLKVKLHQTMFKLKQAETAGDEEGAIGYLKICQDISQKLLDLKK